MNNKKSLKWVRMSKVAVALLAAGLVEVAAAALPTSGNWGGQTITADETVTLTGNINLTSPITVKGAKLTIHNGTSGDVTIKATANMANMFIVGQNTAHEGGGLVIEGEEGKRIIIDGGAVYNGVGENDWITQRASGGYCMTGTGGDNGAILIKPGESFSDFKLLYVTIQNVCSSEATEACKNPQGAAISLRGTIVDRSKRVELDHCKIYRCVGSHGAGLSLRGAAHCDIDIFDCEFIQNSALGGIGFTDYGGLIRTNGDTDCDIRIYCCIFTRNYSFAYGGTIYYNASNSTGANHDIAVHIYGSTFLYNKAGYSGGAIFVETNSEFGYDDRQDGTAVPNTFIGNVARLQGGAIAVNGYNNAATYFSADEFTFKFDSSVQMYNNEASQGGGLSLSLPQTMSYKCGTKINLVVDGMTLGGNRASDEGGGIYFRNGSVKGAIGIGTGGKCEYSAARYTVNLEVRSGIITNNVSDGKGGGIYTENVYVRKSSETSAGGVMLIANNQAENQGGGICMSRTPDNAQNPNAYTNAFELAMNSDIVGNQANDGAGVFITNGIFMANGGNIVSNVATHCGGGVCLKEGTIILDGGNVSDNSASVDGGGFYASQSTVTLKGSVEIKDNEARGNGGGLAVVCSAGSHLLTLEGGTVAGNIATNGNGGGFWISGHGSTDSKITQDIEVRDNIAKNGGGFYLNTNAYFTVEGGFVYANKAVGDPMAEFKTAYKGGNGTGTPEGVGGGFYLASGTKDDANYRTTLKFDLKKADIGIFANRADCAADDIAAEGAKLTDIINMPAVTNMVLTKLAGAIVKGWDEDYREPDTAYSNGTYIVKDEGYQSERYRTVIARGDPPFEATNLVLASSVAGKNVKYMCLTLGYIFPIPNYLWITDHEDLGNGVVNLQFTPCFTNAMDTPLSQWAETAQDGNHLWVVWGNSEEEAISNSTNEELKVNAMCVKLRGEKAKTSVDEDARTVWVRTPFFTNWTHEASSGTNRFYKIVVDDLAEDILKDRAQASE